MKNVRLIRQGESAANAGKHTRDYFYLSAFRKETPWRLRVSYKLHAHRNTSPIK